LTLSPKGCWCALYKSPINKRTSGLQWRIVHGAIALNRHVAHFNPSGGVGCSFCSEVESVFHLCVQCLRLRDLFTLLSSWFSSLYEFFFSFKLFVYGPRYSVQMKRTLVLIHFFIRHCKISNMEDKKKQTSRAGCNKCGSYIFGACGS